MEWPAVLGIYGAIAATLTAGWNIYSGFRDRGRLKLGLQLRRYVQNAGGGQIEKLVDRLEGIELHLSAVNTGRRPLTVVGWYGVPLARKASHSLLSQFPRQQIINETEQTSFVCRDVEALATGFRRMYVADSSGRRWYVHHRDLHSIAKQIKDASHCGRQSRRTSVMILMATQCILGCLSLEDDSTTVLLTSASATTPKDLLEKRDRRLNPEGASEAELKKRTLANLYNQRPTWLDLAHKTLDEAVLDAYGWPHELPDDDILERLLALNLERAVASNEGISK
jgi:hypothetical protein